MVGARYHGHELHRARAPLSGKTPLNLSLRTPAALAGVKQSRPFY
jgi:hypothetical protein